MNKIEQNVADEFLVSKLVGVSNNRFFITSEDGFFAFLKKSQAYGYGSTYDMLDDMDECLASDLTSLTV